MGPEPMPNEPAGLAAARSDTLRCGSWVESVDWRRRKVDPEALLRRLAPAPASRPVGEDEADGLERDVCVCFIDLRGFTRQAESRTPAQLHAFLSRYVHVVSEVVQAYGGTVVEFQGDGVVVAFGAYEQMAKKERAALQAACVVLNAARALRLDLTIGVSTGRAWVGHLETLDRRAFCVLGTPTLIAARLQSMARQLDASLVVDEVTYRLAEPFEGLRLHAGMEVRGSGRRHDVYALPSAQAGSTPLGAARIHPVARRALVRAIVADPSAPAAFGGSAEGTMEPRAPTSRQED